MAYGLAVRFVNLSQTRRIGQQTLVMTLRIGQQTLVDLLHGEQLTKNMSTLMTVNGMQITKSYTQFTRLIIGLSTPTVSRRRVRLIMPSRQVY
jgi:hypothetical protein